MIKRRRKRLSIDEKRSSFNIISHTLLRVLILLMKEKKLEYKKNSGSEEENKKNNEEKDRKKQEQSIIAKGLWRKIVERKETEMEVTR